MRFSQPGRPSRPFHLPAATFAVFCAFLLCALFACLPSPLPAQIPSGFVQTTATVPALANGSYASSWTNLSSSPQLALLGCQSTFQQTVSGQFDASGHFSVLLADTSQICPAPSTWTFTLTFACLVSGGTHPAFTVQVPVTGGGGTEDISAQITALLPSAPCTGGSGAGPYPPAYAVQFANLGVGAFQADPNITINPTNHTLSLPLFPYPYPGGTCWGDSLTQGAGAPAGQDYCAELQLLTGVTLSNQGIYGQTSNDLCARMGACPAPLTLTSSLGTGAGATATLTWAGSVGTSTFSSGTSSIVVTQGAYGFAPTVGYTFTGVGIPYGTTISTVTGSNPYTLGLSATTTAPSSGNYYWTSAATSILGYRPCYNSQLSPASVNGSIGGIPGSCADSGDGVTFVFTSSAASAGLSQGNYVWTGNPGSLTAGLNLIWIGTNDYIRPNTVTYNVGQIVASLPGGSDFVLFPPIVQNNTIGWGFSSGAAGAGMTQVRQISAWEQTTYPGHFLNTRENLVLSYNSASTLDSLDYQHDQTPSSLRGFYSYGTLTAAIVDTTSCTFSLTGNTSPLIAGVSLLIDSENIYVRANTGNSITGCIRGYASSTAATHLISAPVSGYDSVHLKAKGYSDTATWAFQWMQGNAGALLGYATPSSVVSDASLSAPQPSTFDNRFTLGNNLGNQINFQAGQGAGVNNYGGQHWTADGPNAGFTNQSGNEWSACGFNAGFLNVSGSDWFACGFDAAEHATGNNFVAISPNAGFNQTSGDNWLSIGYNSGFHHLTGNSWFAEGYQALFANTTCTTCHVSGFAAADSNVSGDGFTAIGNQSGSANVNGSGWTALGTFSGFGNSSGYDWTALGASTGFFNTTGVGWTAVGRSAGRSSDFGGQGTGSWTGTANPVSITVTSGVAPTVGSIVTGANLPANDIVTAVSGGGPYSVTFSAAPLATSSGAYQWSVGSGGLGTSTFSTGNNPITVTVTSGSAPVVNSIFSGSGIPANDQITVVTGGGPYTVTLTTAPTGNQSGTYAWSGVHGSYWTAVGDNAGTNDTNGDFWTALGNSAGFYLTTSNWTAVGNTAGAYISGGVTHNVTSHDSLYVGANTQALADGDTNEIVVGPTAVGCGSNCGNYGNSNIAKSTFGAGNSSLGGVGLVSMGTKFTVSGCSAGTTVGGATAGKMTLGANTCSVVITMNGATGYTAPNGWSCKANDETTAAGNTTLYFSANNATTATLSVPATAGATDVIDFACTAF